MNKDFSVCSLRVIQTLLLIFSIIFLMPVQSRAETLVLIPGFQSKGMDWRLTQVATALQKRGWVDGGNFTLTRKGMLNPVKQQKRPAKIFYTVDLMTEARVADQARMLQEYLQEIYLRRKEPLALTGHSAGGVVARHWLVTANNVPVNALITIASPHLGTPLAELSSVLSNSREI
ncbi:MAG: esterase/lipase family protein, partial [Thiolinea sp.]